MVRFVNWLRSSSPFVSKGVSAWETPSQAWSVASSNWALNESNGYTPEQGNDIYIESSDQISLASDQSCKDINLNNSSDIIRIINNGFVLNFYGKIRSYSGTAPGTSSTLSGVSGWIATGTLKAIGNSRTIFALNEFSGNATNINVTLDVALNPGQTGQQFTLAVRLGYLVISSGTYLMNSGCDMRCSGNGVALDPLNMQGTVLVKNGATLKGGTAVQRAPTAAMLSFTLDSGGILWITVSNFIIGAQIVLLNGEVIMDATGTVAMPNNTSRQFGAAIDTFSILTLQNTGTYTLQFNTTINSTLRLVGTSVLSLNSKTLSYGTNANLEINESRTSGVELPTLGVGIAIPQNLIVAAGKTYTVVGVKNIRGVVILGAGASIIGTVNQNQP